MRAPRRPVVLLACVFVVAAAFHAGPVQGSSHILSLDEYTARLVDAIRTLAQADSERAPEVVVEVRSELARIEAVRLPSGATVGVEPALDAVQERDTALARLRLLRRQIESADADNTAERLTLLEDVLARPEFGGNTETATVSYWKRFVDWLERVLQRLPDPPEIDVGQIPGVGAVPRVFAILGAGIAAAFLAVLLSYWIRGLAGSVVGEATTRRRSGDDVPHTAADARDQAVTLAQTGNYREAVRALYLAALLSLEEQGLVPYDRSLTNRELLARVTHVQSVRRHLRPVVELFDTVWYGIREPDAATFEDYRQHVDALLEAAPPENR